MWGPRGGISLSASGGLSSRPVADADGGLRAGAEETLPDHPGGAGRPSRPPSGRTSVPPSGSFEREPEQLASPRTALRRDMVSRLRAFAGVMIVLCLFGYVVLAVVGSNPMARFVGLMGLTANLGAYVFARLETRDPGRFSERRLFGAALVGALGAAACAYYFGLFSPFPAIVAIVLFVYSLGAPFQHSFVVYVIIAIGQALGSSLIIADIVDDHGLLHADYLDPLGQVVAQICIQSVFAIAFAIGYVSRGRTMQAVRDLERAVREVAQREALLHEARQELRRAAGIGDPGRFTDQILGSFRLGPILGRGSMGEIYDATNIETGEPAAVKLLHRHVLNDPHQVARFEREARIAASMDVQHVVRVLDVGGGDAELPYIAMERLRGEDLAARLRAHRRMRPARVVAMVRQVAEGLRAARAAGIVHRDLKPHNLFLAVQPAGRRIWKILDFGVSKAADEGGTLTQDHVIGTPMYMAPEQARAQPVDHRADVYALAVIAYRALTGQPPFTGDDVPTVLHRVLRAMPPAPSSLVDVPREVDAVLSIGMAKDRDERFQDAAELAEALATAVKGRLHGALRARAAAIEEEWPWGREPF